MKFHVVVCSDQTDCWGPRRLLEVETFQHQNPSSFCVAYEETARVLRDTGVLFSHSSVLAILAQRGWVAQELPLLTVTDYG